jgi:hypothetical protein
MPCHFNAAGKWKKILRIYYFYDGNNKYKDEVMRTKAQSNKRKKNLVSV